MQKRKKGHIIIGDIVEVISGSHKGETGEVLKLVPNSKLVIKGINYKYKHLKSNKNKTGSKSGEIKVIEAAIHKSNVKLSLNSNNS
uniref:Large ribosomal subunit protein uL24c n=1 Tax=Proboscia sp. TaxID=1923967 RepID=A0A2U9NM85_9STRA|nr:ribosomal protein L24 [Proboscia sp.]